MNKKLKQQLKLTYKPPLPKRKEAFFRQIESQIQTKQQPFIRVSFLKQQKWVWATLAIGLLVVCLYPNPSTTKYQETDYHHMANCQEHIWLCSEELSLTDGKRYVHAQCINCNKISMTIEDLAFGEQSIDLSKEDISW